MAAAYEQFVLDRSSQESLRSAGNGVALIAALIAAPETAGGSYAAYLTMAGGVVASVDIALKNDRLKLNSDADFKAKYQSYYDVWDIFYNSVLLADAGAGVYSLANNLRKVNLVNATKTFYAKMKDFDFNGELMGVWNKLRGVQVAEENLLANYPNIRKALVEVDPILKSSGFDRYRFETLLRQSDNLKYLDENSSLLPEIANKIKPKMQYTDGDVLKIFKDAVNTDFVKTLLPDEFVNSLKKFGRLDDNGVLVRFTEEEIVDYFRNYHNVYTKGEFFTQIENILIKNNPYGLTKNEAYTLWGYTTNLFYRDLNTCLRDGIYSSETADIVATLKSAIAKVPKYNGTAYRAIHLEGKVLTDFLNKAKEGADITFDEFISAGSTKEAAFFNKLEKNVRFIMEVNNAPIISSVADGIKFRGYSPEELLLNTERKFNIKTVTPENGVITITMKQIN